VILAGDLFVLNCFFRPSGDIRPETLILRGDGRGACAAGSRSTSGSDCDGAGHRRSQGDPAGTGCVKKPHWYRGGPVPVPVGLLHTACSAVLKNEHGGAVLKNEHGGAVVGAPLYLSRHLGRLDRVGDLVFCVGG
jgi:hypothetical protein